MAGGQRTQLLQPECKVFVFSAGLSKSSHHLSHFILVPFHGSDQTGPSLSQNDQMDVDDPAPI
jgi:hypothetical protein